MADTFGDSLRFVNRIYSRLYGHSVRKAPAHMPHFMDRNILAEMHEKWPKEFNDTSSHRFRHPNDMQFSFSYYYYVMQEPKPYNANESFKLLDKNDDGQLDSAEIRYTALFLHKSKPPADELEKFEKVSVLALFFSLFPLEM